MTDDFEGKHAKLSIDDPQQLYRVAHALAAPVRLDVIRSLGKTSMNVGEVAEHLGIPMSSAALAIKVLEEAGLILSETQPGQRGTMKICSRKLDFITMQLEPSWGSPNTSVITLEMPIGGFSAAGGIKNTCGLASEQVFIGEADNVASFYLPQRFSAQIIWFRQGYLDYDFSLLSIKRIVVDWLEISFEACSEAPMYRDPWKSDIAVSVNGHRLGVWTSPCDCGGRRGKITPGWWSDFSTQYGFLKTWRVDNNGSYLENTPVSRVTLRDLHLEEADHISVRIEVPTDAQHVGGINLFGEKFGDYAQPIVIRVGYRLKEEQHPEE